MKKYFAAGMMPILMALGTASAVETESPTVTAPHTSDQASPSRPQPAVEAVVVRAASVADQRRSRCRRPGLIRHVAGGDPLANLRDAHHDPQRCKLSICIPASINLDVVCELTTARDSEGRYNCRMVIIDFLRLCTSSCHTGDWRWLDDYRGPY